MRRLFVIVIALLLPLQFAWSAAAVYCHHETSEQQRGKPVGHMGHHAHVCKDEAKQNAANPQASHADCAWCQAASIPGIAIQVDTFFASPGSTWAGPLTPPPFSSALARAPDRPQWLRLV